MANAIKVAELLVEIGLDSKDADAAAKKLDKNLVKTEKSAKAVKEEVGKLGKGLAVLATFAIGAAAGVFRFVDSMSSAATEVGDASVKYGVNVEALQKMTFAAQQTAGVGMDTLSMALKNQARFLKDAQETGYTPFTRALADIGLKLEDIADLKGPEERFGKIGDALKQITDPTEQVALAMKLVGEESGPRLLPFLLEGTEGLKAYGEQAEGLGIVLDDLAIKRAQEFQASMGRMKASLTGVANTVMRKMMPAVERIIKRTTEWVGKNKDMLSLRIESFLEGVIKLFERLAGPLEKAGNLILFLLENFDKLIAIFAGAKLASAFGAVATGFKAMGFAAAGALGPIGAILGLLTAAIPLALEAGNALGDFLAKDPSIRHIKRQNAPDVLGRQSAAGFEAAQATGEFNKHQKRLDELTEQKAGKGSIAIVEALRDKAAKRLEKAQDSVRQEKEADALIAGLAAEEEERDFPLLEEGDEEFKPFELAKPKTGKKKKKEKGEVSITSVSDLLAAASGGGLEDLAATTPSTKGMEPTVAVDITNNNYQFQVTQTISGKGGAQETADAATKAIKKEFDKRLASTGQKLAGNVKR